MDNGSKARLQRIFEEAGRRKGYDFVEAKYFPFKELKSTWNRNRWKVRFRISDYLEASDEVVLREFAQSLFHRMEAGTNMVYGEKMMRWLKSREFLTMNRPLYLERSRNLSLSPEGAVYDLKASLDVLTDMGLVEHEEPYLTWTIGENRRRVGYCSVLMKVIAISSALDSRQMPDFVHHYVLYHEMIHLETGRDSLSPRHGREFRRRERLFPRWEEAESWLRTLADGRDGNHQARRR